jgi:hypothetical protein
MSPSPLTERAFEARVEDALVLRGLVRAQRASSAELGIDTGEMSRFVGAIQVENRLGAASAYPGQRGQVRAWRRSPTVAGCPQRGPLAAAIATAWGPRCSGTSLAERPRPANTWPNALPRRPTSFYAAWAAGCCYRGLLKWRCVVGASLRPPRPSLRTQPQPRDDDGSATRTPAPATGRRWRNSPSVGTTMGSAESAYTDLLRRMCSMRPTGGGQPTGSARRRLARQHCSIEKQLAFIDERRKASIAGAVADPIDVMATRGLGLAGCAVT